MSSAFIGALYVVLAGARLGGAVFTMAVVPPALRAMERSEAERVLLRSAIGKAAPATPSVSMVASAGTSSNKPSRCSCMANLGTEASFAALALTVVESTNSSSPRTKPLQARGCRLPVRAGS